MNKKTKKQVISINEISTSRAKVFLKSLNFNSEQVNRTLKYVNTIFRANINAKTKIAKEKVLKKNFGKKLDLIPLITIKPCTCVHKCGNNYVNDTQISICEGVLTTIKNTYPEVLTTGVSLVKIWSLLLKNGYTTNHMPYQLHNFLSKLSEELRDAFLKYFDQKGYSTY